MSQGTGGPSPEDTFVFAPVNREAGYGVTLTQAELFPLFASASGDSSVAQFWKDGLEPEDPKLTLKENRKLLPGFRFTEGPGQTRASTDMKQKEGKERLAPAPCSVDQGGFV